MLQERFEKDSERVRIPAMRADRAEFVLPEAMDLIHNPRAPLMRAVRCASPGDGLWALKTHIGGGECLVLLGMPHGRQRGCEHGQ